MLIYNFKDVQSNKQHQVEIQLASTNFVDFWLEYLEDILQKVPDIEWNNIRTNYGYGHIWHEKFYLFLFRIFKAYTFFNNHLPYDFKDQLLEIEEIISTPNRLNQEFLNQCHSDFYSLSTIYFKEEIEIPPNITRDDLYQSLHVLNGNIHALERGYTYGINDRRKAFSELGQFTTEVKYGSRWNYNLSNMVNGVFSPVNTRFIDKFTFDYRTDNYDFDVWLNDDINGKDQFRAWLDKDDLTKPDITGNEVLTPNILFDPDKLYKRMIEHEDFRTESSKTKKPINRFPIGSLKSSTEFFKRFSDIELIEIQKENKTIWKKS